MMHTAKPTFAQEDCVPVLTEKPFNHIALTFSGGGFRAASFSLGCLSYLYRCHHEGYGNTLLDHVKFITSTSGGSLTNGKFSSSLYSDPHFSFEKFYEEMKAAMNGEELLHQVFAILKDDKEWEGTKSRNLINAFARVYDKTLFGGKTFDCIYSPVYKASLEKVCFNTTEFNNGLSFYFQINGHTKEVDHHGNAYLKIKDAEVFRHLKIGDIVAASSCFPGGFEPIVYPVDFTHPGLNDIDSMLNALDYDNNNPLVLDDIKNKPIALMDGGIADNMGIKAVMIEDSERLRSGKGSFDLILACDVTSYFVDALKQKSPEQNKWWSNWTLASFLLPVRLAPVILILCILAIIFDFMEEAGYLFLLPSAIGTFLLYFVQLKLRKIKDDTEAGVEKTVLTHLPYFTKLPLYSLMHMLSTRAVSAKLLISDLFLKNTRRNQYDNLFTKPRLVDRTISCLIYEFSSAHQGRRLSILRTKDRAWWPSMENLLMPSEKMQQVANEAKSTGTTLWFDESDVKDEKRDKIIATGQFTMCYNLIKHICRLEVQNEKFKNDPHLQELKQKMMTDFEKFKSNPMFMLHDLKIPG